jgi:hypothetical protein
MARPRPLTVIASLAIAQGCIAILVALLFFGIASIFDQSRSVTSSLMVMIAQARGGVLIIIALMYLAFVVGAWHASDWAWWIGLFVSVLNILYLMHVLLRGESVVIVLLGLIIPLTIIWYLLSATGRQTFGRDSALPRPLH